MPRPVRVASIHILPHPQRIHGVSCFPPRLLCHHLCRIQTCFLLGLAVPGTVGLSASLGLSIPGSINLSTLLCLVVSRGIRLCTPFSFAVPRGTSLCTPFCFAVPGRIGFTASVKIQQGITSSGAGIDHVPLCFTIPSSTVSGEDHTMPIGEWADHPALVKLADGSGYYVTLSVYHSLHCVKRIHHYLYFDHYYHGKSERDRMFVEHHVEHSLNVLFQTLQCKPDLTVFPMQWGATTLIPIGLDQGHHQCMKWERIDNWMKERSFDVFAPGLIVHLMLGDAYPDGEGDELGIALDMLLKDKLDPDHADLHT